MVRVAPRRGPGKVRQRNQPKPVAPKPEPGNTAYSGSRHAIKLTGPAARLQGGPRHGWVYYVTDLQQQQRAAAAMGKEFDYRATGTHTTLPGTEGVQGVVWRYRGAA